MSLKELFFEIRSKGYDTAVVTDINNTSSCIDFVREAPENGIKPIIGIDFRNGVEQKFIGIAKNEQGFKELNEFLIGHLHNGLAFQDVAPEFDNAFVIYPYQSVRVDELKDNEYIGIKPHELGRLVFSSVRSYDKMVILQTVTFRHKRDFNTHRLLTAIDRNILLSKLETSVHGSSDQVMICREKLLEVYNEFPQLIKNTEFILSECSISFEFGVNKNKRTFTGLVSTDLQLLESECEKGLEYRYGQPSKEVIDRTKKEIDIIKNFGFCSYFLINWDMIRYALRKNWYYVGRGSGANSMVAYLLRITDVDPIELDLYFERFINPSRRHPPDFDVDFSWNNRDEITKYLFEKHGYQNTALLGAYNTFQFKAAIREIGKVFGLPPHEIDKLQATTSTYGLDHINKLVRRYANFIEGLPSHLSVHASGILISEAPISAYSATIMPPKGFPTTQFSMIEAEDIGLYKFDILSQRGLGKIRDTLPLVKKNKGQTIDIHDVKRFKKDAKVKKLLKQGKAIGCFYVESPAMRMLLAKLQAETYTGLVAASSIIRPGVAKSGMMREYILRFRQKERRKAARERSPELYKLLAETYGVMVYQEDVIRVAHFFAGLTLAEADILRRGMSWKFKERNEFHKVEKKFFDNCAERGYKEKLVRETWQQIETFANYAFSKGHSASYAVESFQALFLKAYFPLEYMVATINNGGGFYGIETYVNEARLHGGTVVPPCINKSNYETTIYGSIIYLGFQHIQGLEIASIEMLIKARKIGGVFEDLIDFITRAPLSIEQVSLIIRSDGFRFSGKGKRTLLWEAHLYIHKKGKKVLTEPLFRAPVRKFKIPSLHHRPVEDAFDQMELFGFPLSDPFDLLNEKVRNHIMAADIPKYNKQEITIFGYLVTVKNTSTSRGQHMNFGTFLDRDGYFFDTTHFPDIAARFPFRGKGIYKVTGLVAEEFEFFSIEVVAMEKMDFISDPRYSEKGDPKTQSLSTREQMFSRSKKDNYSINRTK